MKNNSVLFLCLIFAFGCSKPKLVKKIADTDTYEIYTYTGCKLSHQEKYAGQKDDLVYTYTDDLITETEKIIVSFYGTIFRTKEKYTYENKKLKSKIWTGGLGQSSKYVYRYISDTNIEIYGYEMNNITKNWSKMTYYNNKFFKQAFKQRLTLNNGNIIKREYFGEKDTVSSYEIYEYDDKNNPFVNVIGVDKLLEIGFSKNNLIRVDEYNPEYMPKFKIMYEYDKNDFPIKQTKIFFNDDDYKNSHTIEYY